MIDVNKNIFKVIEPESIPMLSIRPALMIPVGATGENEPAFAPVHIKMIVRIIFKLTLRARTIKTGATSAVAAMFPAPIADRTKVVKKNPRS